MNPNFPEIEQEMLKTWEQEKTFEQSLKLREQGKRFSFYDGPPYANGLPHYGHVVPVTIKDAVTRYKTMRGYYVPRRNGWDTHGLPIENAIEKELGIKNKQEIIEYGIDKFIEACRGSVFKFKKEWENFFDRLGRWADKENAYSTLDDSYIESVWWVISQLNEKGLLYESFRSMPYCPRCATPLSNFEVNQNYKDDVEDPSVFPLFPLVDDPKTALLAWTTTPWTLPANAALAVDEKADYVTVELVDGQKLILAKERLDVLDMRKSEYKVIKTQKGKELVGLRYQPLYNFAELTKEETDKAHRVYSDAAVSLEDGTGVLHMAPRYGEADLAIGQREGLPLIESVDGNGLMMVGPWKGTWFKEADEHIIADLTKQDRVYAAEITKHTYPFCWRCETPLLYFAMPSWFVKVEPKKLVGNNDKVNWVPAHVKEGRFGNWLAEARDWSISRNRFWGAPLPIWRCEDEHITVIGSLAELKEKAGSVPKDLHRPQIDSVKIKCHCGKEATRIEEVLDCWFESGSMPYAQEHYPFENKDLFETNFPADFIAEGIDQTRGWFYTLHVLATALFDQPAFKNVVVNGWVIAADGQKLSKRLKNYDSLDEVFDKYGADVLRFFMLTSPVVNGEDARFSTSSLVELQRNFFMTLWNVYTFWTNYNDGLLPAEVAEPGSPNVLDRWITARLNQTIAEMTKQADGYQIARAVRPLRDFMDDLSNWYLRRSRRRFKSEDQADREQALATLHYVLARVTQLLAPWSPFLSDKLYRELTGNGSVHLTDWPSSPAAGGKVDAELLGQMEQIRELVKEGLAQRAEAGIKVRQPLAKTHLHVKKEFASELLDILAEEVNVKEVTQEVADHQGGHLDTQMTPELAAEGVARDTIRAVQDQRKQAGLSVGDQIALKLTANDKVIAALKQHRDLLAAETQAQQIDFKVGEELQIELKKV